MARGMAFVLASAALCVSACATPTTEQAAAQTAPAAANSEVRVVVDEVTRVPIRFLTTGPSNDAKIYPTHSQWTADGVRIIFRSTNRAADGTPQIFAVRESDGVISQLTRGAGVRIGSVNISRRSNEVFYLRADANQRLSMMAVSIPSDLESGGVPVERVVAVFPEGFRDSDGFSLDANNDVAYIGVRLDTVASPQLAATQTVTGAIWAVDLATGVTRPIITTPFRVGHVQANPWVSGELMYCHETGGDAPQRMWVVKADGTGNRPLFVEGPGDWVTHESFIDRDHVMFNILGHRDELHREPTGIAVINLRTDRLEIVGQILEGRGFWHSHGTADTSLAVGDDFDGALTLINRQTGERTLLSTGHLMRPDHAHPNFSPDGTRVLIQSGRLSNGESLDLAVISVPENLRAPAQ
jgi:oligogalacturonide lyase